MIKYSDIFDKIKSIYKKVINYINTSEEITSFVEKSKYFIYNFRYTIYLLILTVVFIVCKSKYNYNFKTDKITENIKNAKYVENAVAINKSNFLTTYKSIKETCKITQSNQKLRLFLISNKARFEVYLKAYNEYNNLAVLTMFDSYKKTVKLNNFVLFPDILSKGVEVGNNLYVSKTVNDLKYFYRKLQLKEDKKNYLQYVRTDFIRKNIGEAVLNNKLEFVGITNEVGDGGIFGKKMEVINYSVIKDFLYQNGVKYALNSTNVNLFFVKNYIYDINYKLVCVVETPPVPRTFKVYR